MDLIGDRTLRDLWADQTAAAPDRLFLVYESAAGDTTAATYREFDDHIDRTASALASEFDVGKGDKVAIHLDNSPAYLRVWFAVAKLGAVAVHSNTNHSVREVHYTLDTSDATYAVTQPRYLETVREAAAGTGVTETLLVRDGGDGADGSRSLAPLVAAASPDYPAAPLDPEDDAQILFTSGTTSDPKGVVMTHANLLYPGERQTKHLLLRPRDRNATALPLYHVNAQTSALASLTAGCTFVLFEEYETGRFVTQLKTHGATLTSLIGTQVRALLAKDAVDAENDLRVVTYAINVTDEERRTFESAIGAPLLNGYGLSEAMSLVTQAPIHADRRWPSVGLPVFDRDVVLLDDDGEEVEPGEIGEIAVGGTRGRNVFKAYYGMPEATAEAFTDDGRLLTGDYGRFDEDGYLYFVDRKKNIIETRGENVSEQEVEAVLDDHPGVAESAVVGVPHEIYGEAVKAFVVREDGSLTAPDLREYAAGHLANFKVPEEFEFVDEFPRTSVGKIEKKRLRDDE